MTGRDTAIEINEAFRISGKAICLRQLQEALNWANKQRKPVRDKEKKAVGSFIETPGWILS